MLTSMPKRMVFCLTAERSIRLSTNMFHCHRIVKHKCKRFPCQKFYSIEMFIAIDENAGMELYLADVNNPHATKSENQTKPYVQFQWKCNNTNAEPYVCNYACFIDEFTKFQQTCYGCFSCCFLTNLSKIR